MYLLHKLYAWIGIASAVLSMLLCPFLKVPLKGNWNMYQTDVVLFGISLGILSVLSLLLFINSVRMYRIVSMVFLGWCVLGLFAVYFKINNYFGLKFIDNILAKSIQLGWGWCVLLSAALFIVFSVRKINSIQNKQL